MVRSRHPRALAFLVFVATLIVSLFGASRAWAYSTGIDSTNWTSSGCNTCHSGGTTPTVTFRTTGGTSITTANVNRASSLDLIVRVAGGQSYAGFNVSPSAGTSTGTLATSASDTGVQTTTGDSSYTEVTHKARRAYSSGYADFRFNFNPNNSVACGTTITLTAWGNSVNNADGSSGDKAASDTLTITITCDVQGSSCSTSSECASSYCINGYCCNSLCSGACDACSAALKESGTGNGTCGASKLGTDCGVGGHACNGTSTSCPTTCTSSAQCADGYTCSGSDCVAQYPNGTSCSSGTQCLSGYCVDSVCCGTACTGACQSCSAALKQSGTTNGTCGITKEGTACTGGHACSGTSSLCPTGCYEGTQCASGYYCDGRPESCARLICAPAILGDCIVKKTIGTACTASEQCLGAGNNPKLAGNCVDGVCCSTACSGACDACSVAAGSTANGTCSNVDNTHVCNGTYLCSGTSSACPASCTGNTQCISTAYCNTTSNTCVQDLPQGSACVSGTQCASKFCVDGFCCNNACTGGCDTCAVADGATANGTCTVQGTTVECGAYKCGGSATCPSSCTLDTQCASGNYCTGVACVPKLTNGTSCSAAKQCTSGNCVDNVCCDTACNGGACDACSIAAGGLVDGTCVNKESTSTCGVGFFCTGASAVCPTSCSADAQCQSGYYCDGVCKLKQANGGGCSATNQCTSGLCVDGRCCNSTCTGQCEACNVPSALGTCSPVTGVPVGGRAQCASDGSSCGGACDGSDRTQCKFPGTEKECRAAACADGVATIAAKCAGDGTCSPLETASCAPNVCSGTKCGGGCTTDGECTSGTYCKAGVCTQKKLIAATCGGNNECVSGFCADGFCCTSACTGQCEACNNPGTEGGCEPIAVGTQPHGARTQCTGVGPCKGSCDGVSRTACAAGATAAPKDICDGTDDDCNGTVDDNAVCPAGTKCVTGACETDPDYDAGIIDSGAPDAATSDDGVDAPAALDSAVALDGAVAPDAAVDDASFADTATIEDSTVADSTVAVDTSVGNDTAMGTDTSTPANDAVVAETSDETSNLDAPGAETATSDAATDDAGAPIEEPVAEDGGCGCTTPRSGPGAPLAGILAGLALIAARRSRRPPRVGA